MGALEVGISVAAKHLEEHWGRLQCLSAVLTLLATASPGAQRFVVRVLAQMYEEGGDGGT